MTILEGQWCQILIYVPKHPNQSHLDFKIDDNTKVDTIVFLSESKYNEYREAVINAIGNDETKYSNHTVEVIEQKEVAF